jgi:hypothetical protein
MSRQLAERLAEAEAWILDAEKFAPTGMQTRKRTPSSPTGNVGKGKGKGWLRGGKGGKGRKGGKQGKGGKGGKSAAAASASVNQPKDGVEAIASMLSIKQLALFVARGKRLFAELVGRLL